MTRLTKICTVIIAVLCVCVACTPAQPEVGHHTTTESTDVATISIFASSGANEKVFGLFNFGHAFVALTNISDGALDIDGYVLEPSETVTISTWSLTAKFGVWFNVESAFIDERDKYSDRVSVSAGVSAADFDKLGEYLFEHNKWSVSTNCTSFSVGLFNLVTRGDGIRISGIFTPEKLKNEIMKFENFDEAKPIPRGKDIGYLGQDGYVGGYTME